MKIAKERLLKRYQEYCKNQKNQSIIERRNEILNNAKRIRTYNFKTNTVKDHRTGKTANLQQVLNGNLDLLY